MKKHASTIFLIFIFFVGLSVLLYPSVSNYINQKNQSRAVANYEKTAAEMAQKDTDAYFQKAEEYNKELASHPELFYEPSKLAGYEKTLDITGTGIMGYISIPKIKVELPITMEQRMVFCRLHAAIWRAAAFRWEEPRPMRYCLRTEGCQVPNSLRIWTSWRRRIHLPLRFLTVS